VTNNEATKVHAEVN